MRKILVSVFLFLVLTTSACGAQAPVETAAPTPTATQTAVLVEIPTATEVPSVQASATLTPETPIPTNPPDCTNSAAFVADVTVADNDLIAPGADFTKTWRIKNTGTCVWTPEYTLSHYSEERMLAPASVPLSITYPNETMDISMDLTAPSVDGKHKGFFVIKNPAGLIMKIDNDSRLWVLIDVSSALASIPTSEGTASIPVTGGLADATCAFSADAGKVRDTIIAVNNYRAQNGLSAYAISEKLTRAASAHANDMACNNSFTHTGSNGSTPASRVAASGYTAAMVTENVHGSYPPLSGQGAVDWWKSDQTDINHNLNLLSTTYTEIGVGYSFFNNYGYYVVVFATP